MERMEIIKSELTNDPLGRGYASMTDKQAAIDMNTNMRSVQRDTPTPAELVDAIDPTEYPTIPANQRELFNLAITTGSLSLAQKSAATTTNTKAALAALATSEISRSVELVGSFIKTGHVEEARR